MRIKNPDPASVIAVVGVVFSLIYVLPYLEGIFQVLTTEYGSLTASFLMVLIVSVILLEAGVFDFLFKVLKKPKQKKNLK